ncbi:hypothetical protein ACG7TL_008483 [Trametes sanguinea]
MMTTIELPPISSFVFKDDSITFPPIEETESGRLPGLSSLGLAGPSAQGTCFESTEVRELTSGSCLGLTLGEPAHPTERDNKALACTSVSMPEDQETPRQNARPNDFDAVRGHEAKKVEDDVWRERDDEDLHMWLIDGIFESLDAADREGLTLIDHFIVFTSTLAPN